MTGKHKDVLMEDPLCLRLWNNNWLGLRFRAYYIISIYNSRITPDKVRQLLFSADEHAYENSSFLGDF